jgi:hypothetical protein
VGDCAEAMETGEACCWCGAFFVKPHGYPVLCRDCWVNEQKRAWAKDCKPHPLQEATEPELE